MGIATIGSGRTIRQWEVSNTTVRCSTYNFTKWYMRCKWYITQAIFNTQRFRIFICEFGAYQVASFTDFISIWIVVTIFRSVQQTLSQYFITFEVCFHSFSDFNQSGNFFVKY